MWRVTSDLVPRSSRLRAVHHRLLRTEAFGVWREVTWV